MATSGRKSIGSKYVFAALIILTISIGLAIPLAALNHRGFFSSNLQIFAWTLLLMAVYLTDQRRNILKWLIPLFVLNLILIWQFHFVEQCTRTKGLFGDPNATSGLLVLSAVYFLASKNWKLTLLALPFIASIPFTGSRNGLLMMGILAGAFFIKAAFDRKPVFILAPLLGAALIAPFAYEGLFGTHGNNACVPSNLASPAGIVESVSPIAVARPENQIVPDITYRLDAPELPGLLPKGFLGESQQGTLVNTPERLAVFYGIFAAIAWLGVTGFSLWKKPRFDLAWWLLLAMTLLSIFDYYTMRLAMELFWWILISVRIKGRESRHQKADHNHPSHELHSHAQVL